MTYIKRCPSCNEDKASEEYSYDKSKADGCGAYCKECRRKKSKVRQQKYSTELRSYQRKIKYGMSDEEWNLLFDSQGNKCAICPATTHGNKNWHIDHDHSTGKVRGLLCHNCNLMLGHAKDNVDTLSAAIKYLGKMC
jgi:hypothetical protein